MYSYLKYFAVIFLVSVAAGINGQTNESTKDTLSEKRYSLVPLPLIYFTPETRWGFGAGAFLSFRLKGQGKEVPPSQLQFGVAYTLEKQFLSYFPFQLFLKDGKLKLYGELGYYRYVYRYYGNGSESRTSDEEFYSVNFPRVRWNALYRFHPKIFAGFRYFMDDFDIQEVEEDGILATQNILGSEGGLVSALGLVANYDSRDDIFYPSRGSIIELSGMWNANALGSDFNFQKIILDAAGYFSLKEKNILALNLYAEFTLGDAPFNQLALLGGTRRMRGYFEGRFRDDHFLTFQSEYRFPVFKRLKGAVFGSVGSIGSQADSFERSFWAAGVGIRIGISKTEKVNLRLDYGFGKNTSGFYLTIGEAF
ncbi:MAG: BamA/TamA family outer membrane protein [Bacteroidota bacterium]